MPKKKYLQGHHFRFEIIDKGSVFLKPLQFTTADGRLGNEQLLTYERLIFALNEYVIEWASTSIMRIQIASSSLINEQDLKLEGIMQLLLDSTTHFKKKEPMLSQLCIRNGFEEEIKLDVEITSSYERNKSPFSTFNRKHNHLTLEFHLKEGATVIEQVESERFFLSKLYGTKDVERRKSLLIEETDWLDLLKFGPNILENIDLFCPEDPSCKEERPMCFPFWAIERLKKLEEDHPVMTAATEESLKTEHHWKWYKYVRKEHIVDCNEEGCFLCKDFAITKPKECAVLNCLDCEKFLIYKKDQNCGIRNCKECHEYMVWRVLYWWYDEIFLRAWKEKGQIMEEFIMPDGSVRTQPARLKSLVIKGPRESGKTKFFQGLCGFYKHRTCIIKHRFHRHAIKDISKSWLLIIEDFSFRESTDLQMLKSIVAGEPTVIEGKWLSLLYQGGIPCVILLNEDELYWYLYNSPNFRSQCKFIDLGDDLYLGPLQQKHSAIQSFDQLPNVNIEECPKKRLRKFESTIQDRSLYKIRHTG